MSDYTVELALDSSCDLGESPIYDDRTHTLYFVDINKKTIHAFNTKTNAHEHLILDEPIGCIALTSNQNQLLAATQRDILLVQFPEPGVIRTLATTPEDHGIDKMRFNDGKISPQGSLLVGRMHSNWRQGEQGRAYALDTGSSQLRETISTECNVCLPNGMAWSVDGSTCFFVDSGEETITAYTALDDMGIPTAESIQTKRVIYNTKTAHRHVPDGMCIDSDNNLWVAFGESASIMCIDSTTGEEIRKIQLPVQRPTSCIFGGEGLKDLYVVTRVESGENASKHHGGLYRIRGLGVAGLAHEGLFLIG